MNEKQRYRDFKNGKGGKMEMDKPAGEKKLNRNKRIKKKKKTK